jgi:hypothetical protein
MVDSYVLFDIPNGNSPRDKHFLEQLGHRVMVCPGPASGTLCPILSGDGCELAANAHGIVFELDLDRPQHRSIVRKYKSSLRSDLPIWVVVSPAQAIEYADLLKGIHVLDHAPVAGDLDAFAAEVEAADI